MTGNGAVPTSASACRIHHRRTFDCQDAYIRRELTAEEIDACLAQSTNTKPAGR